MKKTFLLINSLIVMTINSIGQISSIEAVEIASQHVDNQMIGEYLLYQNTNITSPNSEISTFDKSIYSVSSDSWMFFLDKNPLSGWSHPCSFIFVDVITGIITEIEWKLPPNHLDSWELLTEIKEQSTIKPFKIKPRDLKYLKSGITPDHCFAIIISGGYDKANNWQRYWNDCSAIYNALTNVYNYDESHIYTIMADGTNPADDRRISGGYDSSPLDLDGDGDNDIQYSATKANITSVFNTLSGILNNDDYLFIFVTDHGGQVSGYDAEIYLWGETIQDDELATEINKVNAGEISIVMEQCYSGGFIDDLEGANRVIATACDYDETSCGMGYYTYDEFIFDWIAAVAGEDPNGNYVNADYSGDGFVSMQEAFDYAVYNDACAETPQYYSNENTLGEYLTLLGTEIDHCGNNYQDFDEIGIDCGGADCQPCSGYPDPGSGDGPPNPCRGLYTRLDIAGFYINGQKGGVIEVCKDEEIILSGPNHQSGCIAYFFPNFDKKLFIAVTLCDEYLNPIDDEFMNWQEFSSPYLLTYSNQYHDFLYVKPFNLLDFLPSPYITFYSGQTYRVKIANSDYSGWSEYTNYIHLYTDNRNVNNQIITNNIYGRDITIQNSTVQQPIEVVANNSIHILHGTTLKAGRYYIDNNIECSYFKNMLQINKSMIYNEEVIDSNLHPNELVLSDDKNAQIDNNLSLYPNPTNGKIRINLEGISQNAEIYINNSIGKNLIHKKPNSSIIDIDLSNFDSGLYIIKIKTSSEIITRKVIKN